MIFDTPSLLGKKTRDAVLVPPRSVVKKRTKQHRRNETFSSFSQLVQQKKYRKPVYGLIPVNEGSNHSFQTSSVTTLQVRLVMTVQVRLSTTNTRNVRHTFFVFVRASTKKKLFSS